MKTKPSTQDALWMAAGAAILAVLLLVGWHFYRDPSQRLAMRASRANLVDRIEFALASAAEAERSAVLAASDEDSRRFSDQARASAMEVEHRRRELGEALATGGTQRERELLAQFSRTPRTFGVSTKRCFASRGGTPT